MLFWYSFGDAYIIDIALMKRMRARNKKDMFRESCGYESSTFYFLYVNHMNESHVYTLFLV